MTRNHFHPFSPGGFIPGSRKDSQIYLSRKPEGKLVIFVHGFFGSALGTWDGFPAIVRSHSKFSGCDIVFHGYDWKSKQVAVLGNELHDLIDYIADDHRKIVPQATIGRNWNHTSVGYKQVTIISHSLGGLVSRYAVLKAHKKNSTWKSRASMIMYAPAHNGNRVISKLEQATSSFSGLASLIFQGTSWCVVTIDDLSPNSQIITSIKQDTDKYYKSGNVSVAAKSVLWAAKDRIVFNVPYPNDPDEVVVPDTDHITVCKPTRARQIPITAILGLI